MNSGRLSVPCNYVGFDLFGEDALGGPEITHPGMTCTDAPLREGFLLDHLGGGFNLLAIGTDALDIAAHGIHAKAITIATPCDTIAARYLGDAAQAVYLIRPDQHVVARWATFDEDAVKAALGTAIGKA